MEFQHGDQVIVTDGFYKGLSGNVVAYNGRDDSFDCILRCTQGDGLSFEADIDADNLRKAL